MQVDIALFLGWMDAFKTGNEDLAKFYEERFTATLKPAFAAWMATDPLNDPGAPLHPFIMDAYRNPLQEAGTRYDELAHESFALAEQYSAIGDAFVHTTLLLAIVLFFGGVCTKVGWRPAQLALLGLAILLFLFSAVQVARLPDGSDWGLTPFGATSEPVPHLEDLATPVPLP